MDDAPLDNPDLEDLELSLLLEAVNRQYGVDFRNYADASLRRRIRERVVAEGVRTVTGLLERVLHDPECMDRLLLAMSVHVTSMFRDPEFFLAVRQRVVPMLRTYPFVRIWHAGCATGEEVYSMAILLEEEGLLDRCRLYATDMNEVVLARAREGIVPLGPMQNYTTNYLRAGGKRAFSDYYTAAYDCARLRASLRENMIFGHHNLATDGSFNEFNLIVCRNVMIYFNRTLQARATQLLYDSLGTLGVLALGRRESLRFSPVEPCFEPLDARARLYRRVR